MNDPLLESASIFRNILESSTDSIFVKDKSLRLVFCNDVLASAVGKTPEETYGKTDIENGWDPDLVKGNPAKGIRGWEKDDFEVLAGRTVRAEREPSNVRGEIRYKDTVKIPIRDPKGNVVGILGIGRDVTDREAALESAAQHAAFVQSSDDAIVCTTLDGTVVSWNQGARRIYGYAAEEIVGRSISVFFPEGMQHEVTRILGRIVQGETVLREQATRLKKDGRTVPVSVSVSPIRHQDRTIVGAIAVVRDISERVRLEESLRESKATLQSFYDSSPFIMCVAELDGDRITLLHGNLATSRLLSIGPRDLSDRHADPDNPSPKLIGLLVEHCRRCRSQGTPVRFESRHPSPDGARWISNTVAFLGLSGQGLPRFSLIGEDITDRKRADASLRASEEKFRRYFELGLVGMTITSPDKRFIEVNDKICEILGYDREELLGLGWEQLTHPDDLAVDTAHFDRVMSGDIDGYSLDTRFIRKDGTVILTAISVKCIRAQDGSAEHFLALLQDITERTRTMEALQTLQKLESLGALAAGIAHDFNNHLTAILGNISLAREGLEEGDERRTLLAQAEEACGVTRSLAGQLLTFATGGSPSVSLLDLGALIREQAVFAVRGTSVRCVCEDAPSPLPALADPQQMRQVVQNLVLNAVQAMPHGGTLTVGASIVGLPRAGVPGGAGRWVRATFRDEGVGIPSERIGMIFDPFFSTKERGRGLGLTMCHSIVARHHGWITVESTVGTGSTFTVFLPAADECPAAAPPQRTAPVPTARETGRVLILDDERAIAGVLSHMLGRLGYLSQWVPDGRNAVEEYCRARESGEPYGLLIMDMTIPGGMGGKEALEKLKEIDPDVRAVMSSGYSNLTDYASYGFRGILAKPYTLSDLSAVMDTVMKERAAEHPGGENAAGNCSRGKGFD
jgi:PAS domain S-box-containing protein